MKLRICAKYRLPPPLMEDGLPTPSNVKSWVRHCSNSAAIILSCMEFVSPPSAIAIIPTICIFTSDEKTYGIFSVTEFDQVNWEADWMQIG